MKLSFPLYAKILLWFFLNLLLLAAVFYGFFRVQFHVGLDALLAGQAGDRVEALCNIIAEELHTAPAAQRSDVLNRFGAAYGVKLFLFRVGGEQVAGEPTMLPSEVRARIVGFGPPPLRQPQPPFEVREPPPRLRRGVGEGAPRNSDQPGKPLPPLRLEGAPGFPPPPPADEAGGHRTHPKFMVRSTEPSGYWVGVRLPASERGRPEVPQQVLLIFSPTLSGGGLFIDFKPWLLVGFGALLLSMLFWFPLIRSITLSIKQLTRATGEIAEGHFDVRVDEHRRDELGRLGAEINSMAARLDGFVTGQKRFLGDVAHELCSPLARMQVALGILEQRAEAAQQDYVKDVREEVQEMSNLVNELLSFSRASLREKVIRLQRVTLAEIVRRVVERETGGQGQVHVAIPDGMTALAEPDLLARALANLVRNALRYAVDGGPISITAETSAEGVVLSVSDSGPGVPEEALQKIFDPFYRLEASRSRDTGGIGLGLAIVKTCVEACQGTVTAQNRLPSGLQVSIRLKC